MSGDLLLEKKEINKNIVYDFGFDESGDFTITNGLDTSVLMSLEAEKRASTSEVPNPELQRGWIGNLFNEVMGYEQGNKKWQYTQARLGQLTLNNIVDTIKKGFLWYVEDGIADKVTVEGKILTSKDMNIEIKLFKNGKVIKHIVSTLWKETKIFDYEV